MGCGIRDAESMEACPQANRKDQIVMGQWLRVFLFAFIVGMVLTLAILVD